MAFDLPITAFRHAPWGGSSGLADLIRLVDDWHDAAFLWVIADSAGGASQITLTSVGAGSQGVSATYDDGYIHPTTRAIVGATTIRPQIDEATLEALTDPVPASADIVLYHTLYVTPTGGIKRVECYGSFTVKQGAPG
jgi:hypothetical protein